MATPHQDGLDPSGAQTPQAFMQLLRQARTASGLSLVEISERARERGYDLDPVGLHQALDGSTLPAWQIVTGVLTACGMGGMQIDRWMRVYHDLGAPTQPVALVPADVTAVLEPIEEAPVSVPPLILTTIPATPARLGRRHLAIAAGVLAALVAAPLLLLTLVNGGPDTVAAEATSKAPRTSAVVAPAPSPSDLPVELPTPTAVATPTTPAPATRTTGPPPRTSAPPPPSPSPSPPPSPADPGVLRSGVVALTGNQGFDLDSGQTEGERDFYRYDGDTLVRRNDGVLALVSGTPSTPSKQSCQAVQSWRTSVGNLQAGHWLCVRTSDGRYARLNITTVGTTLKLAYTVWT